MANPQYDPLSGRVEADETFIGGDMKKMNTKRKSKLDRTKRRWSHGATVFGMVERSEGKRKGRVRAFVIPGPSNRELQGGIRRHVVPGSRVYTDGFPSYRGLDRDYAHFVIDHAYEYVRGHIHTNSI